ncbi:MAG: hypothetical protein UX09_C0033G0010 [Candidatus Uhrbacteria bacterium GW2011_GWE2_45_35]|uniref:Uncharacterized protein n=2 Tax=Candidatus Uhriibacteriota TaxID=1752732 RepID=A0A0G1JGS2_9BACT|nr:MAG: hypothetical protein UW63_C0021G0006 [Candidatus Uhrbacteria bacterium GW2011_GWF2_44_350]KKU07217.1 MAG: hypothetical protein UX09_C0033G0010 [Candidatus Uhrbacteria bacterium GW2011_GWE2_45_35]HBR80632.1 hypothetical protein [Candidatus Uhrbacteria bacterium]HCU31567.1 hypothetical protein [Candidatus Uhrbacteria bacterium]
MSDQQKITNIVIMPRIQADTAAAIYLLRAFGEKSLPGVSSAPVLFWTNVPEGQDPKELEKQGYLLIDLGGIFDHHNVNKELGQVAECVSTLIAKHLGIDSNPALKKLLTWARRDDLEGKGTISSDALDRAFGLSGIIMNLNRRFPDEPQKTLDILMFVFDAHVREEWRRNVELPELWEKLLSSGQAEVFQLNQGSADLNSTIIETDDTNLPGFLRAAKSMDFMIQRRLSGHTNFLTKQIRSLDLGPLAEAIRRAEAAKKGLELKQSSQELQASGRIEEVPNWYYDTAANTLQNGGVNPQNIEPTLLSKEEILDLAKKNIPLGIIGRLKRVKERDKEARDAE